MKLNIKELEVITFLLQVGINDEEHRADGHPCQMARDGRPLLARLQAELTKEKAVEEVRELKERLAAAESRVATLVQVNDERVRTGAPRSR